MAIKPIEILIRAKDEASSVFSSMQAKAGAVATAIAAYFGFSAFAGAVKGAADLEAALSDVAAVSGAGAKELAALRAAAEAAGASTKFTATEAAVALGNLARAGLDSNQAIAALKPTLQLAQAGSIDLGQAAEITTKAIAGFGLKAEDAGRIADVLAKGANASNTSVRGLGEAMSYAAPMAKSVGLDLESTVAIMGKFADGGIDASRAGTALNSILSQFADPSSKFKAALSDAGITTLDFNKALVQLAAKGKDGEKAILAVGMEAGPALRSLLNQGIPALNELRNSLKEAGGSAEATAKIMGDNLKGAMDGLSSAWDAVKVKLGTPVLPVLKSGVDQVAASLKAAVDGGLITKFGDALASGFKSAIEWGTQFLQKVNFEQMANDAKAAADKVGAAFDSVATSAKTAGGLFDTIFGTLTAGFNALLVPIYKWGEVFATVQQGILTGVAAIAEKLSLITFGTVAADFKAAAAQIKSEADAAGAVAEAMGKKSVDALIGMTNGAEQARSGFAALSGAAESTAPSVGAVGNAAKGAAADLDAMGKAAESAGSKSATAAKDQAVKLEEARSKVAELRAEYEKARQSGDTSKQVEALQKLEHATNAATVAARALNKENDDAADKAAKIKDAFAQWGIQTKAELEKVAATAKDRFETIKSSGLATTDGLREAFKKMAEAAIAANGGVADGTLKAQASMYKLKITTDEFGKSVVTAMDQGTASTNMFGSAVANATSKLEAQNAALERQISAQEKANELTQRAIDLENKRKGVDREGFSVGANGQRINESVATAQEIEKRLIDGSMNATVARSQSESIARAVNDEIKNAPRIYGTFSGGEGSKSLEQRVQEALRNTRGLAGVPGTGSTQAAAASVPGGAAKTYNVQLGARTIKTASDADAQSLIAALKDAQRSA